MLESFDFDAAVLAPFRMQPGLRRVRDGSPQLTPLEPGSRHQREKVAVLSALRDDAMVAVPGFDPGPALDALCAQAQAEHPAHFTFDGTRAAAPALGVGVDAQANVIASKAGAFGLGDELPRCVESVPREWRRAALLALAFAEDIAIVDGTTGHIPWLCVALPSRWAPREKVGRHFAEIHAPVADNATLLTAGEHLMRLVCKPERWERFVWNVTDHPRLNAHPRAIDRDAAWAGVDRAGAMPAAAWFRSERQSFLPLPARQQALFLIGVDVVPLGEAIDRPDRAKRLHDAIASMSPSVLAYRGLEAARAPLLAWLDAQAR